MAIYMKLSSHIVREVLQPNFKKIVVAENNIYYAFLTHFF